MGNRPIVAGIDAGGTMTDTILVDGDGRFTIGKAETTPAREADGFLESAAEAAENWGLAPAEMFRSLEIVLYSGTGIPTPCCPGPGASSTRSPRGGWRAWS